MSEREWCKCESAWVEMGHCIANCEVAEHPVFKFLLGEGPLDGRWFGDDPPVINGRKQRYWWRRNLRTALNPALLSSPRVEEVRREALEEAARIFWRAGGRARVIEEIAKKMDLYDPRVGDMIRALKEDHP